MKEPEINFSVSCGTTEQLLDVLRGIVGNPTTLAPNTVVSPVVVPDASANEPVETEEKPAPKKKAPAAKKKKETPEEAKPAKVNVTEADEAKDVEDEAAEEETGALTIDDVKGALMAYGKAYGTTAVMDDGPKILEVALGKGFNKLSTVPATQEAFGKAVEAINEAIDVNPYEREAA